ncbi:MAG TPA: trehalose-phosphatase [Roseateles sp.]|nr:trehalose-phosphatase [Roseateles sp.]
MRYLFSPAGERALLQLMRQRVLLAFDFDGTLAPIVARPDDAHAPIAVQRRLADLARQCPVAVITGRSVADARPRLGFEPTYLIGNHGAEGLAWRSDGLALGQLREQLLQQAPALQAAGVQLEDKGLSLALHYRLARDRNAAQGLIAELLDGLPSELVSFGGKCVVNVVQRAAPDKGVAVETLLHHSGCTTVLFVGDDVNDEAVFERARPDWLTVRIGPEPGGSQAMFFLASHAEMAALLEKIQQALSLPNPAP